MSPHRVVRTCLAACASTLLAFTVGPALAGDAPHRDGDFGARNAEDGLKYAAVAPTLRDRFVTVTVQGSGAVTKSPELPDYPDGSNVTLTAAPAAGWHFVRWSGDASGSANPLVLQVNDDLDITAIFAIDMHTLSVAVVGNGSVVKVPNQPSYPHGSTVNLVASGATHWHFVAWSGDTTSSANPLGLVMNAHKAIVATFAIDTHLLNVNVVGNGSVLQSPDQPSYDHGSTVTLTGVPDTGWHFVGWSGDVSDTNPVDVVMNSGKSITATFEIDTHVLSVSVVGNGSVIRSPDQPAYDHGEAVTLTAVPAHKWRFASWSGDVSDTTSPLVVVMDADKAIAATFVPDSTHTLTVAIVGQGSVSKNPDLPSYPFGTIVTLTATPAAGYHFIDWQGDVIGSMNPITTVMSRDRFVRARFGLDGMAVQLPTYFESQLVVTGLDRPTGMAFLPDGRLLVVEQQRAWIRLIAAGGLSSVDPIGVVDSVESADGEQGLLGVAVDPGWPARPYVYVQYTAVGGTIRVSRYRAEGDLTSGSSGFLSLPSSSRYDVLRDLQDQETLHNGGTLRFGPDGKLYVSLGDDANACHAQDTTRLVGVLLRLDVSQLPNGAGGPPDRALLVPPDNPYALDAPIDQRLVLARGLRNPFRFHIDPVGGAIFVADVGFTLFEEIDLIKGVAGGNFAWPYLEGPAPFVPDCNGATLTPSMHAPIHWYDRPNNAAAVISAGVYRSSPCLTCGFPQEYRGDYFFSDFYQGFLRRLTYSNGAWSLAAPVPGQPNDTDWGRGFEQVSDYLMSPSGAVWYCRNTIDFQGFTGEIGRITFMPPVADVASDAIGSVSFASPYPLPARDVVRFSYALSRADRVKLDIFDPQGRLVRRLLPLADQPAGRHDVTWDGRSDTGARLPAGVYLASLSVDGHAIPRKVVLAR